MKKFVGQAPPDNNKLAGAIICTQIKKPHKVASFNGGADDARFELFIKKYINHLFTPNVDKICSLIEKLSIVTVH